MIDYRVNLKVCEGCGALWLRAEGQSVTAPGRYCTACTGRLSQMPVLRPERRGRKRLAANGFSRAAGRTSVCAGGAR